MRFIYIDSQGKEVSIPTVDALALRIELGAITEATRLWDEASDRWAPAAEHEIYRSLMREQVEKSGGFVAPPPPAPAPPPPAAAPVPKSAASPPSRAPNPFEAIEGPGAPAVEEPPPKRAPSPPAAADALGGLDFDLTLSAVPIEPARSAAADRAEPDSFGMELGPPLTLGDAELTADLAEPAPAPKEEKKKEEAASFDFAGFGGMLTDDGDDEEDEEEAPAGPPEVPAEHGMTLEGVLASSYGAPSGPGGDVVAGGMDLEQPLSDLPIDQGGWSPKDRLKVESAEDEAGAAAESASERSRADEQARRPERPARERPASSPAPQPRKSSAIPALVAALLLLAVVGGGAWFGWTTLQSRKAAAPVEPQIVDPPVVIPAISPELEPRMRELADSTMADWLLALRTTLPTERGVPVEPSREWLSGSYLADASQHADVEQYWRALDGYVGDLEEHDVDQFAALYRTRLDSAGVAAEDADAMLARARAGFLAGRPDRRPIYRQVRDVIDTSMGLHEFLIANEDRIEHDPAAGGASRDPVLEAIPATPELGREMWGMVDGITESLDALGALDRVTTDRLFELVGNKLGAVPIR